MKQGPPLPGHWRHGDEYVPVSPLEFLYREPQAIAIQPARSFAPVDKSVQDSITVVITTSPIPSNPSTEIIDETIGAIRWQLPLVKILILVDGVRPEEEHRRADYEEYIFNLMKKLDANTEIRLPTEFLHQVGLLRVALAEELIRTPLILWNEHDWPLCEKPIDWVGIAKTLLSREVDCIYFSADAGRKLNCERGFVVSNARVPLIKTIQHTSTPQIGTKDLFQMIVDSLKATRTHLECPAAEGIIHGSQAQYLESWYWPVSDPVRCRNIDGAAGRHPNDKFPNEL